MRLRSYLFPLLGLCCIALDRWLGLDGAGAKQCISMGLLGGIIAGASSLGSGLFGSISANRRRRQAERQIEKQKRSLKAWRDAEVGTNYLDRADARSAMRRVFEFNREAQKSADTDAVKRGLTDEAKVAQASRLNRNFADVVSQIAGAGARHKDRVQEQYLNQTRNLDMLKVQNLMDSSGVENMVSGAAGAASGLGLALAGIGPGGGAGAPSVGISPKVESMAQNAVGVPAWENRYKI